MRYVIGLRAVLAVSDLVDDEHASLVRSRLGIVPHHPQAARIQGLHIPGRFREEELQPLRRSALGSHHWFHAGQGGKRLVAIPAQQQSGKVLTEASSLGESTEEIIEALGVIFERTGRLWASRRLLISLHLHRL